MDEVTEKNFKAVVEHMEHLDSEVGKLKTAMETNSNRIGTILNEINVLKQGIQMTLAKQYGSGPTVVDNGD